MYLLRKYLKVVKLKNYRGVLVWTRSGFVTKFKWKEVLRKGQYEIGIG